MAKTILEIATSVLQRNGRLAAGNVPKQYHIKIIEDSYEGLHEELLNDSQINWSSSDDIPDFASDSIITLLLGRTARAFGVNNEWIVLDPAMRRKLSKQIAPPYEGRPTQFSNI
jgi:hypothetical protein